MKGTLKQIANIYKHILTLRWWRPCEALFRFHSAFTPEQKEHGYENNNTTSFNNTW